MAKSGGHAAEHAEATAVAHQVRLDQCHCVQVSGGRALSGKFSMLYLLLLQDLSLGYLPGVPSDAQMHRCSTA